MKQFFFGLVVGGLVAVLPAQAADVAREKAADAASNTNQTDSAPATATDPSQNTNQTDSVPATDPSLCLDSMETAPDDDDLVPTPTAMDGGCSVSGDTIST